MNIDQTAQGFLDWSEIGDAIYIVQNHNEVLYPWIRIRRSLDAPLLLLSLDHHTDLLPPPNDSALPTHVDPLDAASDSDVVSQIIKVKKDRHIVWALDCGLISEALVIHHKTPGCFDDSRIFESGVCGPGDPDSECCEPAKDCVLSDSYLRARLNPFEQYDNGQMSGDYILDIDLDYFHTRAALDPRTFGVIGDLARGAVAITIAKEGTYVEQLWDDTALAETESVSEMLRALLAKCI